MQKKSERIESLIRVVIAVISGVIFWLWAYLSYFLIIINWIYALILGKRSKDIAEFVEYWTSGVYNYFRYLSGETNQRPFPFSSLMRIGKFEK